MRSLRWGEGFGEGALALHFHGEAVGFGGGEVPPLGGEHNIGSSTLNVTFLRFHHGKCTSLELGRGGRFSEVCDKTRSLGVCHELHKGGSYHTSENINNPMHDGR